MPSSDVARHSDLVANCCTTAAARGALVINMRCTPACFQRIARPGRVAAMPLCTTGRPERRARRRNRRNERRETVDEDGCVLRATRRTRHGDRHFRFSGPAIQPLLRITYAKLQGFLPIYPADFALWRPNRDLDVPLLPPSPLQIWIVRGQSRKRPHCLDAVDSPRMVTLDARGRRRPGAERDVGGRAGRIVGDARAANPITATVSTSRMPIHNPGAGFRPRHQQAAARASASRHRASDGPAGAASGTPAPRASWARMMSTSRDVGRGRRRRIAGLRITTSLRSPMPCMSFGTPGAAARTRSPELHVVVEKIDHGGVSILAAISSTLWRPRSPAKSCGWMSESVPVRLRSRPAP